MEPHTPTELETKYMNAQPHFIWENEMIGIGIVIDGHPIAEPPYTATDGPMAQVISGLLRSLADSIDEVTHPDFEYDWDRRAREAREAGET